MTTGRSNKAVSETRRIVSWKVERGPNNGRNCLGWTSREAGHSRVPAPPHMMRGIIRRFIGVSNPILVAIPGDKTAKSVSIDDCRRDITHLLEGLGDVAGLHRQHLPQAGPTPAPELLPHA